MPYAQGRTYNDADSHIMETKDWLFGYADPSIRDRLSPMTKAMIGSEHSERLIDTMLGVIEERRANPHAMKQAEAELMTRKYHHALGGFDPAERSRALDLLGFNRQLVFTGSPLGQFWAGSESRDSSIPRFFMAVAAAHNRGIADFCAHDRRLVAVGFVPLDVPELAAREVEEAVRLGCGAIWVPAVPPPTMSPTHPDLDPVWERMQDLGVPFVLHLGGSPMFLRRGFAKNGRTTERGALADDIRAKEYATIHFGPEAFMSAMILDGVLERFPRLRGGRSAGRDLGGAMAAQTGYRASRFRALRTVFESAAEALGVRTPSA